MDGGGTRNSLVNFETFFRLKKHRPAEEAAERAGLRGALKAADVPEDTRAQFQKAASREPLGERSDAEITSYLARVEADVRAMNTTLAWKEDEPVAAAAQVSAPPAAPVLASVAPEATVVAAPEAPEPVAVAAEPVASTFFKGEPDRDLADAAAYFQDAARVDAGADVGHGEVGHVEPEEQPLSGEAYLSVDANVEEPMLENVAQTGDAPEFDGNAYAEKAVLSDVTAALPAAESEYEREDVSMNESEGGQFYELGESTTGGYDPADDVVAASERSYGETRSSSLDGGMNSSRLAEFHAFRQIADDLEEKLRSFAEVVSMSRLTAQSMTPFLSKIEGDIQMGEEVERERDLLAGDLHEARRALEQAERDLDARSAALESAVERAEELQGELDQRRVAHQELLSRFERLRKDHERAQSDAAEARVEIVRLTSAVARESAEKESYFRSRVELSNKYAKLQQAEAQARNKYLELTIQYEKLAKAQPLMVAEQEKLRNELRASQREVASLQNRLLAAQDRTTQLETEMQALQGFSASEAYSTRTELEMQKSALRVAEKSVLEAEQVNKDMQRQLRDAEAARASLEEQLGELQAELKAVRDERADAAFKLSDVNLKYMADLLALDQQREQNKEFQNNIEALLAEKQRLGRYEALYKAAEGQIISLKEKLGLLAENLKDSTDPEKLRRSLEIIGELTAPHVAANTDKPPRGTGRKVATH